MERWSRKKPVFCPSAIGIWNGMPFSNNADLGDILSVEEARGEFQPFLGAGGAGRFFVDGFWFEEGSEGLDDAGFEALHALGADLEDEDMIVDVDDEPREAVPFCVDEAIGVGDLGVEKFFP